MSDRYVTADELKSAHDATVHILKLTHRLLSYSRGAHTASAKTYNAIGAALKGALGDMKRASRYFLQGDVRLSVEAAKTWHEATVFLAATVHNTAHRPFAVACIESEDGRQRAVIWKSCWPRIKNRLQSVAQFDLEAAKTALEEESRAADEKLRAGYFEPTVEKLSARCEEMRQFVHRQDEHSRSLCWARSMIGECWEDMVRIDPAAPLPQHPEPEQLKTVTGAARAIKAVAQWCRQRGTREAEVNGRMIPRKETNPPDELLAQLSKREAQLLCYLWQRPAAKISALHESVWRNKTVHDEAIIKAGERLNNKLSRLPDYCHFTVTLSGEFILLNCSDK